jgi:hypothetical protein
MDFIFPNPTVRHDTGYLVQGQGTRLCHAKCHKFQAADRRNDPGLPYTPGVQMSIPGHLKVTYDALPKTADPDRTHRFFDFFGRGREWFRRFADLLSVRAEGTSAYGI